MYYRGSRPPDGRLRAVGGDGRGAGSGARRQHPQRPRLHGDDAAAAAAGLLRRVAHAHRTRSRALHQARHAAARRADQPPRPGGVRLARGVPPDVRLTPRSSMSRHASSSSLILYVPSHALRSAPHPSSIPRPSMPFSRSTPIHALLPLHAPP